MKNKRMLANLALLLTAFIWGNTFVAQSVGMRYVGPYTFLWTRSFIGAAALVPVIAVMDKYKKKNGTYITYTKDRFKTLVLGGLCCGLALCIASALQQVGMQYTSVGNAGFITSMYMVLVPIFSIFLGKKVKAKIWVCVAVAAVGMYFLSVSDNFAISKGDMIIAVCAVFFAVQIMVIDYFSPRVEGVKMSLIQFLVTGVLSLIPAVILEGLNWSGIASAIIPILCAGVLSSGVAYTLQIVAQKYAEPTVATLFMSLESVFALLGGIVILKEIPTLRESLGCVLVFVAVLMSQISLPKKQIADKEYKLEKEISMKKRIGKESHFPAEEDFERFLGIESELIVYNNRYNDEYHRYEPSSYVGLECVFDELAKEIKSDCRFVDFGCGKGRVIFYVYQRFDIPVCGIEIDDEVLDMAKENRQQFLRKFRGRQQDVELVNQAAEEYTIRPTDTYFYFFNPFTIAIFEKVLDNIIESVKLHPRTIYVIMYYANTEYQKCMQRKLFTQYSIIRLPEYERDAMEKMIIYSYSTNSL